MSVPYVIEPTGKGARSCDLYSRLLADRIIFLGQEIDDAKANLVAAQLLFLEGQDPTADIGLYINSPGGSVTAGFAIFDTMNYIQCDVSTICIGYAASFASFLLAAGAQGKRFALPNAQIMMHQPAIAGAIKGPASDIKIISDCIQRSKRRLNRIYAENTGRTIAEIERDTDRDYFMTSQEAQTYGLIDAVVSKHNLNVE